MFKFWLFIFVFLISLYFVPSKSLAATRSWEITTGIPPDAGGGGGYTFPFLTKIFDINYEGGQFIVSSSPDGTGSTYVDDGMRITSHYPGGGYLAWGHIYVNGGVCGNIGHYLGPTDITPLFRPGANHVVVELADICGGLKFSTPLYLTNLNAPDPLPSPTPTPTPIPPSTPFLNLPWDYQSQGKTFEEVAFDPFSWFDHKYPLQNFCCDPPVMKYTGDVKNEFYQSHNGYDYASKNGVVLNTPVLAAASGTATFKSWENSGGAGNVIKIDHSNGYQTWYEHLSSNNLIVSDESQSINVEQGQKIGEVGMTGNTTGPHIHFSVFEDLNDNGSFEDDNPLGVTDPLGWEGKQPDPWPADKEGAQSHNLFIARGQPTNQNIPTTGGSVSNDKITINIPQNAADSEIKISLKYGPFESISNLVRSITPSFLIDAFDLNNQRVSQLNQPATITYDYSNADLSNIDESSLRIYSFSEETLTWEELSTTLDEIHNTALAQTPHFSQFALMGQVQDLTPPTTQIALTGDKGQDNWYRSSVQVQLNGEDNDGGIGLEYTLYTINGNDWFEFDGPLVFGEEGHYKITYQSIDKAENQEERKAIEFDIDKTAPEAKVYIDPIDQNISVLGVDEHDTAVTTLNSEKSKETYLISDIAGNTLEITARDFDKEKLDKFRISSLKYNLEPEVIFGENFYKVFYKGKPQSIWEMTFEQNEVIEIRIEYDANSNKSTITTYQDGLEQIEIKDGLVLLQLQTNNGNLDYSY